MSVGVLWFWSEFCLNSFRDFYSSTKVWTLSYRWSVLCLSPALHLDSPLFPINSLQFSWTMNDLVLVDISLLASYVQLTAFHKCNSCNTCSRTASFLSAATNPCSFMLSCCASIMFMIPLSLSCISFLQHLWVP